MFYSSFCCYFRFSLIFQCALNSYIKYENFSHKRLCLVQVELRLPDPLTNGTHCICGAKIGRCVGVGVKGAYAGMVPKDVKIFLQLYLYTFVEAGRTEISW